MTEAIRCRLCENIVYQQFVIKKESPCSWFLCKCGYLFNNQIIDVKKVYNKEYIDKFSNIKASKDRYEYYIRVYAPLIEEMVYGRRILDIGAGNNIVANGFRERGWFVDVIDIAPVDDLSLIQKDFMDSSFPDMNEFQPYDVIWLGNSLQCFSNPEKVIYKAYNLLKPKGLLFISTPNTDNLTNNHIQNWGHWDIDENRGFINKQILLDIFGKVDESLNGRLNVVYMEECIESKRFPIFNVMHVIAQKHKIEPIPNIHTLEVEQKLIKE